MDNKLGVAHGEVIISVNAAQLAPAAAQITALGHAGETAALTSAAAWKKTSTGMLIAGGVIAAGLGLAVKSATDFEKGISDIGSVTGDTGASLDAIREKALQLGADTVFSAGEAADAMFQLATAGLTTKEMLEGAADATVALAAAGQVDMPTAASIMAAAMNNYGMAASEAAHVADLMAGAANKSATDVIGVGEAFKYAAPLANAAGVSIEDLTTAIATLAEGGITGSMAGTTLRQMLIALTPQSDAAAREMKKLGLITEDGSNKFYDASGNLKDMNEISGLLQGAISGLSEEQKTQALSTIFGSRALAGAVALAGQGKDGFTELGTAIAGVDADQVAKQRMDNLAGSVEQLMGSIETMMIQIGSVLTPVIRTLADSLTWVTNIFSGLSDGVKTFLVVGALATATVLLLVGTFVKFVQMGQSAHRTLVALKASTLASDGALRTNIATVYSHITAMVASTRAYFANTAATIAAAFASQGFVGALKAVALAAKGLLISMGPIGLVLAAATAGLVFWMQHTADAKGRVDALSDSIDTLNGKLTEQGQRTIAEVLIGEIDPEHWRFMDTLGLGLDEAMAAIQGTDAEMTTFIDKLWEAEGALTQQGITAGVVANNINDWHAATSTAREAQQLLGEEVPTTSTALDTEAQAAADAALEAAGLADELGTTTDAFAALNAALSASAAMDRYRESLAGIEKMIKAQGTSLDATTEKGRTNRDSLREMFGEVATAAESWGKRYGKSQDEIDAKAAELMKGLRKKLVDGGFDEDDLRKFMKGLNALPAQLTTVTTEAGTTLSTGLNKAGVDGGAGLALGIASQNPAVIGAVRKMTALAIAEARTGFDTGSPSKVFIKIGGDVVDGLTLGLANLKGVSQTIQDALGPAIDKANDRIAKWVARQKAKLDEAVSAWNDYYSSVLSAITGNVNMGDAWTQTQDQIKAAKDAQDELTAAQKEYNAAVADANADAADSGKPAKAVDNSAVVAAQSALDAANAAVRSFEQNFTAQINDSYLFGSAFQSASAAIADQFGIDSPIWQMLSAQMLAMGPGAGTEMAQYIAENGLTPEMRDQLVNWNAWSGIVAEQQATYNKQHGIDMAEDAMLGLEDKIAKEQERLEKIGKQIGAGVIIGFKSKKGAFRDAVDAYIEAANRALGINSPSRVFMGIGEQVAKGFEIGLRNGLPDVQKTMESLGGYSYIGVSSGAVPTFQMPSVTAAAGAASAPGNSSPVINARVYVGDREITDIVRTEVSMADEATMAYIMGGA